MIFAFDSVRASKPMPSWQSLPFSGKVWYRKVLLSWRQHRKWEILQRYRNYYVSFKSKARSTLHCRNLQTEVLLWKSIKCFPSTLRRTSFKTQQSPVILISVWGKLGRGNHIKLRIVTSSFSKSSFFNFFFFFFFISTWTRKAGVFKFLRLEERFRKY